MSKKINRLLVLGLFLLMVLPFDLCFFGHCVQASQTRLKRCQEALVAWQNSNRHERIFVFSDFDGTVVDTDQILVQVVIPAALRQTIRHASRYERPQLKEILKFFESSTETTLPKSYLLEDWNAWKFPIDALPIHYGETVNDRLIFFWSLMAKHFRRHSSHDQEIPVLSHFIELKQLIDEVFSSNRLQWLSLTSRTQEQIGQVIATFRKLGIDMEQKHVVHRGASRGIDSTDNAQQKSEALKSAG